MASTQNPSQDWGQGTVVFLQAQIVDGLEFLGKTGAKQGFSIHERGASNVIGAADRLCATAAEVSRAFWDRGARAYAHQHCVPAEAALTGCPLDEDENPTDLRSCARKNKSPAM